MNGGTEAGMDGGRERGVVAEVCKTTKCISADLGKLTWA